MEKILELNGEAIHGIPSFYEEINRLFMAGEDWKIGQSLDALNDILYGGVGVLKGKQEAIIRWSNSAQSRQALGKSATIAYYEEKLRSPQVYNTKWVKERLEELENGSGKTYYELVLEVVADHPNITLEER